MTEKKSFNQSLNHSKNNEIENLQEELKKSNNKNESSIFRINDLVSQYENYDKKMSEFEENTNIVKARIDIFEPPKRMSREFSKLDLSKVDSPKEMVIANQIVDTLSFDDVLINPRLSNIQSRK